LFNDERAPTVYSFKTTSRESGGESTAMFDFKAFSSGISLNMQVSEYIDFYIEKIDLRLHDPMKSGFRFVKIIAVPANSTVITARHDLTLFSEGAGRFEITESSNRVMINAADGDDIFLNIKESAVSQNIQLVL
jgi:hypothetical protein